MATERPVRVTYDPEARAAYVYLTDESIVRSEWPNDGDVGIDYDEYGRPVGIELLHVARPVVEELRRGD